MRAACRPRRRPQLRADQKSPRHQNARGDPSDPVASSLPALPCFVRRRRLRPWQRRRPVRRRRARRPPRRRCSSKLFLPLRHQAELDALLAAAPRPELAALSPLADAARSSTRRFGADPDSIERVQRALQRRGLVGRRDRPAQPGRQRRRRPPCAAGSASTCAACRPPAARGSSRHAACVLPAELTNEGARGRGLPQRRPAQACTAVVSLSTRTCRKTATTRPARTGSPTSSRPTTFRRTRP